MKNNEQPISLWLLLMPVVIVVALAVGLAQLAGLQAAKKVDVLPAASFKQMTNRFGMHFINLPAGQFKMGNEALGYGPERVVQVRPFYMGSHEVTQAQWQAVMGYNPSEYKDPQRPVEQVAWTEVQAFLEELNRQEGTNRYRLPSEAEWEYAARAGSEADYFFGDNVALLKRYSWFGAKPNTGTRPVASKAANDWGLHDMYGNVWEWVQDCWHDNYQGAPTDSRVWGGGDCSLRVLRGGGWNNQAQNLGSAVRGSYSVNFVDVSNGFRVAVVAE